MAASTNAKGSVQLVLQHELQVMRFQLSRNGITTIHGSARFLDPHTLEVKTTEGPVVLASDYVLIACSTRAVFDPASLKVLGVHAMGDRAAEIIHIGQAVMNLGATIVWFRDTVFNYPTMAEAYKVAALDGLNKR